MSQITSGIRGLLSHPSIYDLFQDMVGADRWRHDFVSRFVHPLINDRVLDIGCGTARILDYLPLSIAYYGFDASRDYIDAAIRHYGKRGEFICANVDEARLGVLGPFDLVLASGVLHHLDDHQAIALMKLAHTGLKPGGRLITIDPCLAPGQNPLARFMIVRDRGQNVRDAEGYRALPGNIFSQVTGSLVHRNWIPYTHWVMECRT